MTHYFEPGFEIRALPDGRTLVSCADGSHYSLTLRTTDFTRLVDAWFGGVDDPCLPPTWREDSRTLRDLLDAHRGPEETLERRPRASSSSKQAPGARFVLVTGDERMTPLIADALAESGRGFVHAQETFGDYREVIRRAKKEGADVVLCHSSADDSGFEYFARLALTSRIDWVPVTFERENLWIGPHIEPGRGAQFHDLHERRIAAAAHEVIVHALREQPLNEVRIPVVVAERFDALTSAFEKVRRTPDLLVQVRLSTGGISEHTVLPVPRNPDVVRTPHRLEDMVSPECGIVTGVRSIRHHPSLPAGISSVQVDVACSNRVSQWDDVISCQGSTWQDEESARLAALGETAERYAANRHDSRPLIPTTYERLKERGTRAIEPGSLVLYSQEQYADPLFPAVPFLDDTELEWIEGWSETRNEAVRVPAALVYTNWRKGRRVHEPLIHLSPFAGVAAGPTKEFALISAIEELVERHATTLWWLNGLVFDELELPDELSRWWRDRPDQRATVIPLPNEFGIPVAAGILRDSGSQLLNIGFAARDNIIDASLKAWSEAITLQEGSRDLLDAGSLHLRAIRNGVVPAGAMKAHRDDRRYLDDFAADFSDCVDLMAQQQVYLDPRAQERVHHLIAPSGRTTIDEVPSLAGRLLEEYKSRIEARGYEIISVDITPPDIESLGLGVYRVVIPGLIGNAAAAHPLLGGNRVFDIPVELGWTDSALDASRMNRMPIPHA